MSDSTSPPKPENPPTKESAQQVERPRWLSEKEELVLSFRSSPLTMFKGLDLVIAFLIPFVWFFSTKEDVNGRVIYLPIPWAVVILGICWFTIYIGLKAYYGDKKIPTSILVSCFITPFVVVVLLQVFLNLPMIEIYGDMANFLYNLVLYGLWLMIIRAVFIAIIAAIPIVGVKYYITTSRIVVRRFLLGHKEIPLPQIEAATFSKPTILHKLLNVGDVDISTTGERATIVLHNVYKPDDILRKINDIRLRGK